MSNAVSTRRCRGTRPTQNSCLLSGERKEGNEMEFKCLLVFPSLSAEYAVISFAEGCSVGLVHAK